MAVIGCTAGFLNLIWFSAILEFDYDIESMSDFTWDQILLERELRNHESSHNESN